MPVQKSKVHHCVGQIEIIKNNTQPPAPKCRCRKLVTITEATKMVKNGDASWVVLKRTRTTREEICKFCKALDPDYKLCDKCQRTGKEVVPFDEEEYSNDVVLATKDKLKVVAKTPRSPTIEEEHILRAYVSDSSRELVEEAERGGKPIHKFINDRTSPQTAQAIQDRIEEYGGLILEERLFVGPEECKHAADKKCDRCDLTKGTRRLNISFEPPDDPAGGTGRRYDWGRTI